MATNGIKPEEKIQKMTECIQLLAVTQGMYLANIDAKIEQAITAATESRCEHCKAMKHTEEFEQQKHEKEIIDDYLEKLGVDVHHKQTPDTQSWLDTIKSLLLKPHLWVTLSVMFVSPHGVEIAKALCEFFAK